jgi:hypothetical protein
MLPLSIVMGRGLELQFAALAVLMRSGGIVAQPAVVFLLLSDWSAGL